MTLVCGVYGAFIFSIWYLLSYDVICEHFLMCWDQSILFKVFFLSVYTIANTAAVACFFPFGESSRLTAQLSIFQIQFEKFKRKCAFAVYVSASVVVTESMINNQRCWLHIFGMPQQLSIMLLIHGMKWMRQQIKRTTVYIVCCF